ncbi:MAG: hypothetical protein ACFFAS_12665 [Promethearchaeota archaeon]
MKNDNTENRFTEKFRAVIDENTSISMFNKEGKKVKSICVIRKDLAKNYDIEVDASEAPILNKILNDPEPYEASLADIKILDNEVFPINEAIKEVYGTEEDLLLYSIKLAIGGSPSDYVTIGQGDLIRFNVKPTLTGLMEFIRENQESILGFLDAEYVSEEGNVIYLNCRKKNISSNNTTIKLKIIASMQQRGYYLQEEHKYYGLQLYLIIETFKPNNDKLLELLKELGIDWELIFFRRRLAIHDWTEIECEHNSENLKNYLQTKYDNLNYFDLNNITRLIVNNQLPFIVADKMGSLLYKMKNERTSNYQVSQQNQYDKEYNIKETIDDERKKIIDKIDDLRREQQLKPSIKIDKEIQSLRMEKANLDKNKRKVLEKISSIKAKMTDPEDVYSVSLKKAEIVASARLACTYLGINQKIDFDQDISMTEVLKYQEELTNI